MHASCKQLHHVTIAITLQTEINQVICTGRRELLPRSRRNFWHFSFSKGPHQTTLFRGECAQCFNTIVYSKQTQCFQCKAKNVTKSKPEPRSERVHAADLDKLSCRRCGQQSHHVLNTNQIKYIYFDPYTLSHTSPPEYFTTWSSTTQPQSIARRYWVIQSHFEMIHFGQVILSADRSPDPSNNIW